MYKEEFPDRTSALRREYYLKHQKRRDLIEFLVRTSRSILREGREFPAKAESSPPVKTMGYIIPVTLSVFPLPHP